MPNTVHTHPLISAVGRYAAPATGAGRGIALAGVVLPLALIGILKFTAIEIEALKPVIGGTPWLAWLYRVLGEAGTSYLLGTVEIVTAALFAASPWSARAGTLAGAIGALTFAVTSSTLLALPIWEGGSGGFPWLNALGAFLIKDIALLGISLVVLGEGLVRLTIRHGATAAVFAALVAATTGIDASAQAAPSCMVTVMGSTFDNCASETPAFVAPIPDRARTRTPGTERADTIKRRPIVRRPAVR